MDMSPTDIADVTGATYIYLMNGNPPGANWRALFNPVERVRLRFINTSSMTIFDVRIPGLLMIRRAGRRKLCTARGRLSEQTLRLEFGLVG
jgi:FtsP/CotA-like multicopper oxidase with cupredoxin domain